jgi:hypothetical protein
VKYKELIGNLLRIEGFDSFKEEKRISNLIIALRNARAICGRNLDNGFIEAGRTSISISEEILRNNTYYSTLLLAVTFYLIILDLIGCVFSIKSTTKQKNKEGVVHALQQFTTLEEQDIDAIKSLRNSLAHNFGLANESHIFSLSSINEDLITHPRERWYGKVTKQEKYYTKINEVKVCQLVEDVFSSVVNEFKKDNLVLKKGLNEVDVKARFTLIH